MSISSIRNASQNKGCQVVLGILGLAMTIGMALQFGAGGQNHDQSDPEARTVFTIEGQKVSEAQFTAAEDATASSLESRMQQFQPGYKVDRSDPREDFRVVGGAIMQILNQGVDNQLAAQFGIKITDQDIIDYVKQILQSQVNQLKIQLMTTEKVKPEDVDKEFTKRVGKSAQQYVADTVTQVTENLKDPAKRKPLADEVLQSKIQEKFASQVKVTDEDLKKDYDTYTFDAVSFEASKATEQEKQDLAQNAHDELVKGADPKAVRAKYVPDSKAVKEDLSYRALSSTPTAKPLLGMKVGDVSDVVNIFGYPAVYKLVKIENKLPKDFDKTKAQDLAQRKSQDGAKDYQDALVKGRESVKIEWQDQGIHAVYLVVNALSKVQSNNDPTAIAQAMKDAQSQIKALDVSTGADQKALALANFTIQDNLVSASPGDDTAALQSWVDSLNEVFGYYVCTDLRLTAAQRLLTAKMNEDAFEMVLQAAKDNRNFDETGQGYYTRITQIKDQGKESKAFTEKEAQQIDDQLSEWLKEKVAYDKDQADMAAEQKKVQEELDKDTIDPKTGKTKGEEAKSNDKPATGAAATGDKPADKPKGN